MALDELGWWTGDLSERGPISVGPFVVTWMDPRATAVLEPAVSKPKKEHSPRHSLKLLGKDFRGVFFVSPEHQLRAANSKPCVVSGFFFRVDPSKPRASDAAAVHHLVAGGGGKR